MQTKENTSPPSDLQVFFEPQAVAIVGVSRTPGFGHLLPLKLKNQGWGDRIYMVNPSGGSLHGMQ